MSISSASAIVLVAALVACASAWTTSCSQLCPPDRHPFCTMQVYAGCPASLTAQDLIKRHEPFRATTFNYSVGYSFRLDRDGGWWQTEMAAVNLDFSKVRSGQQSMTTPAANVLLDHYLSAFVVGSIDDWMNGNMGQLKTSIKASVTDMWYRASQTGNDALKAAFGSRSWANVSETVCKMAATQSTTALRCRYCEFAQLLELCQ
eukprot:m51a1_g8767 hypothetical protein (204) ;mRNA; f:151815-152683